MKKLILMASVTTLLFFGCKEDEPVTPDRGRSFVHLLGSLEADTFSVTLDYYNADDIVISDFYHHRNFPLGGYADLEASGEPDEYGNGKMYVTLSRQPFANLPPDTLMEPKHLMLERDAKATVCFVDSFGTPTLVKFEDDPAPADAVNSQVRFINLCSLTPSATLNSTDAAVNITGVGFLTASAFTPVAAGFHTFQILDGNGNVVSSALINVSPYTTYTFYVSGSTSPQIQRYAH